MRRLCWLLWVLLLSACPRGGRSVPEGAGTCHREVPDAGSTSVAGLAALHEGSPPAWAPVHVVPVRMLAKWVQADTRAIEGLLEARSIGFEDPAKIDTEITREPSGTVHAVSRLAGFHSEFWLESNHNGREIAYDAKTDQPSEVITYAWQKAPEIVRLQDRDHDGTLEFRLSGTLDAWRDHVHWVEERLQSGSWVQTKEWNALAGERESHLLMLMADPEWKAKLQVLDPAELHRPGPRTLSYVQRQFERLQHGDWADFDNDGCDEVLPLANPPVALERTSLQKLKGLIHLEREDFVRVPVDLVDGSRGYLRVDTDGSPLELIVTRADGSVVTYGRLSSHERMDYRRTNGPGDAVLIEDDTAGDGHWVARPSQFQGQHGWHHPDFSQPSSTP